MLKLLQINDRYILENKGYSDAKITSYNMSTSGTSNWLSTEGKDNYDYEKYNNDKKLSNPWLKVIYNAYWGDEAAGFFYFFRHIDNGVAGVYVCNSIDGFRAVLV